MRAPYARESRRTAGSRRGEESVSDEPHLGGDSERSERSEPSNGSVVDRGEAPAAAFDDHEARDAVVGDELESGQAAMTGGVPPPFVDRPWARPRDDVALAATTDRQPCGGGRDVAASAHEHRRARCIDD